MAYPIFFIGKITNSQNRLTLEPVRQKIFPADLSSSLKLFISFDSPTIIINFSSLTGYSLF